MNLDASCLPAGRYVVQKKDIQMLKAPVFISGLRKSGTSMVKALLDSHPDFFVFPANELHLFKFSYHPSIIKDKSAFIENPKELLRKIAYNKFISRIADKNSEFYIPQFNFTSFKQYIENSEVENCQNVYEVLFKAFYYAIEESGNPDNLRFVSKTVLETEFFPELLSWYPDMKFIYVLRNPYAHFVSAIKSLRTHSRWNKKEAYEGMKLSAFKNPYPYLGPEIFRMKYSYYFMEKFKRLYPDNFHILVYDDLLKDSETELKQLTDFLRVDYNATLLKPTILDKVWEGNSWRNHQFNQISKAPLDEWKQDISGGEIRLLNKFFQNITEKYFSLETSGSNILKPFQPSEYVPHRYILNRLLYFTKLF